MSYHVELKARGLEATPRLTEYIDKKMGAADLLNYVHATKGIAIAAHPFRKDRPVKEVFFQNRL